MQTHKATEQRLETRQAAHTQTASESVSDGAAALNISLVTHTSTPAAGRRYPRARNQIVQAVKAHLQAVVEAAGDGSAAVLELGLEEASALIASWTRFPRARNPIVNAVKARVLTFVACQAVRMETAAAVADEEGRVAASSPASGATPRLNLTKVWQYLDNHIADHKRCYLFGLRS